MFKKSQDVLPTSAADGLPFGVRHTPFSLKPLTFPRASFLPSLFIEEEVVSSQRLAWASGAPDLPEVTSDDQFSFLPLAGPLGTLGIFGLPSFVEFVSAVGFHRLPHRCVWLWPALPLSGRDLCGLRFFLSLVSNLKSSVLVQGDVGRCLGLSPHVGQACCVSYGGEFLKHKMFKKTDNCLHGNVLLKLRVSSLSDLWAILRSLNVFVFKESDKHMS